MEAEDGLGGGVVVGGAACPDLSALSADGALRAMLERVLADVPVEEITSRLARQLIAEEMGCEGNALKPIKKLITATSERIVLERMQTTANAGGDDDDDEDAAPTRIRKKKHAGGRAEPITTGATPARKRLKLKSKSNNKENCENDVGREDQRPKPRVRPQPAPRESPVDKGRSRVTKAKRTRKRQALKSKGDGDDEDAADSERDAEDAPKGKHILRESKQGIVSVTLRSAYHVPICEHVLTVRLLREDKLAGVVVDRSVVALQLLEHDRLDEWVVYEEWGSGLGVKQFVTSGVFPEFASALAHFECRRDGRFRDGFQLEHQFCNRDPPSVNPLTLTEYLVSKEELAEAISYTNVSINDIPCLNVDKGLQIVGQLQRMVAKGIPIDTGDEAVNMLRTQFPFLNIDATGVNAAALSACRDDLYLLGEAKVTLAALTKRCAWNEASVRWIQQAGTAFDQLAQVIKDSAFSRNSNDNAITLEKMFAVEQPRQTARGHAFRRFTNRRLLWHCGTRLTNLQLVLNGTFSIADAFQDVLSDDIIHMSRNRAVLALCEIADDSSGTFTKEIRSRSMPQRPNTSIVNVNDETQLSITTDDCCPASALPEISRITVADAGQIRLRFIVTVRRSGL